MDVDDVVPASPGDAIGGGHARQHVGHGHRLVAQGAPCAVGRRLVVREVLVALRGVPEARHGDAAERSGGEPPVRRGEHLGLDALGPEPDEQFDQPGRDRVALEARKRRRDVENADARRLALTGLESGSAPYTPAPWWRERLWPLSYRRTTRNFSPSTRSAACRTSSTGCTSSTTGRRDATVERVREYARHRPARPADRARAERRRRQGDLHRVQGGARATRSTWSR